MDDKSKQEATEFKAGDTIRPTEDPGQTPTAPIPATPTPAEMTAIPTGLQSFDQPDTGGEAISWTASEYIDHAKSFDWYLALIVGAVVLAGVLYLLFRDMITAATPVVAALALAFYARRQPRQLQYQLDSHGLNIDAKHYSYNEFRSYSVMEEGPFVSLVFLPLKRFGFLTTVYLDPNDESRILDLVSRYLPMEPREHDMVDRLMKRIRF